MSFDREERLNINTCRINDLLTLIFRPEFKSKLKYSDEKKKKKRGFSVSTLKAVLLSFHHFFVSLTIDYEIIIIFN